MSAPASRSSALNVESSRFGCSARILDFLPILAKNASMGIDGSAVATGAWPVATYKYKAAGRINTPTSTPSKNLSIGLKVSYLRNFLPATRINRSWLRSDSLNQFTPQFNEEVQGTTS